MLKWNLDGSSNGKLDPCGIVRVLRDHEGNFVRVFFYKYKKNQMWLRFWQLEKY